MAKLFGINGEELGGDGANGEPEPILDDHQTQCLMLAQAAGHRLRGLPFPTDAEIEALIAWATEAKVRAMALHGMLQGKMVTTYQAGWDGPRFLPLDGDGHVQREDTEGED